MAKPFYINEEISERAHTAGLNQSNCAYLAANMLASSFRGIDFSSKTAAYQSFRRVDYTPDGVEMNGGGYDDWSAQIGCQACKATVTVTGKHYNQKIGLPGGKARKCPLFNEEKTNLSDDELFAEDFVQTGERMGYYAECFGYKDPTDGSKKYYALIMPKEQYDKLLQETNERLKENADFLHQSFSPWTCLPWAIQIEQPTFRQGHSSRKEALLASMQAMRALKKQ